MNYNQNIGKWRGPGGAPGPQSFKKQGKVDQLFNFYVIFNSMQKSFL